MSSASGKKEGAKPKKKFSRFLFWLLLVVFFGICGYLLFFSVFLDIDKIEVAGNHDIPSTDIVNQVEKYLDGKYFGIFPRKNFIIASQKNIGGIVRNTSGRLEVISVEKKFPKTIMINVIERKAEMVWCAAGVCYFVDNSGLAYSGAAGTEEELRADNFLVVVDSSAIPVEIGKTKIDREYMAFVESADSMIRDGLNLEPAESYHTPGIPSQEISVMINEGWILKLSSEYSIDDTKKIIQTLFEKDLNGDARKNLDYLDLRIKDKIYYKLKEGENGSAQ